MLSVSTNRNGDIRFYADSGATAHFTGAIYFLDSYTVATETHTVLSYGGSSTVEGSGNFGGLRMLHSTQFPPDTVLISVQQLIRDFGGSMTYNHDSSNLMIWNVNGQNFNLAALEPASQLVHILSPHALAAFTATLPHTHTWAAMQAAHTTTTPLPHASP